VVNQARAFVFPEFQGGGLGVRAHRLLETSGRRLWEERYGAMSGFDTLCTDPRSRLFASNGWTLVGKTLGYSRDPSVRLSRRVDERRDPAVRDNAGLSFSLGNQRWWIWIKVLRPIDDIMSLARPIGHHGPRPVDDPRPTL
jgi:hypothetical protein